VARIRIDRLPIGPIYVDKQVMTYGDTINATTGNDELDELIGLSAEISSTLYVGEYSWDDVLEYDPNYIGDPTIAGTTASVKTLTIEKRNATILLQESSSTYDGKEVDKSSLFKIDGVVNGDDLNVIVSTAGNKPIIDAGAYTLVATANDANYNIEKVVATYTVKPASIKGAKVTLKTTSYTYNGKAKKPAVTSVVLADGTELAASDYKVTYKNNVNAGTATATVTGKGNYTGTATAKFTIKQAAQSFKSATPTKKTIKAADLAKAAQSFTVKATLKKGDGKVTYKLAKDAKKIVSKVTSAGKVTIKKGTKAGKYVIRVKATAAKTKNYKAKNKTWKITITVK
jgi:hypothetical protein